MGYPLSLAIIWCGILMVQSDLRLTNRVVSHHITRINSMHSMDSLQNDCFIEVTTFIETTDCRLDSIEAYHER